MSYVGVNWQLLSGHVLVCQSEKILHRMLAFSVHNNTGPVYLSFYTWEDWGERGEKEEEWGWRTERRSQNRGKVRKRENLRWGCNEVSDGCACYLSTACLGCQSRQGVRAKCVYVYMCVSDGSVCVYVAVRPIAIYKALPYNILERTRGESRGREGFSHFLSHKEKFK